MWSPPHLDYILDTYNEYNELKLSLLSSHSILPYFALISLTRFYTYYSLNGQTVLPQPLDNSRYPNVRLVTVREFFTETPKERLGKTFFLEV